MRYVPLHHVRRPPTLFPRVATPAPLQAVGGRWSMLLRQIAFDLMATSALELAPIEGSEHMRVRSVRGEW
jgi:hypothetical protein